MADHYLEKLFAHNNWANLQLIRACAGLSDEQLDAEPQSATKGTIRGTLLHLAWAQQVYLTQLTMPLEQRLTYIPAPAFTELEPFVSSCGSALQALARDPSHIPNQGQIKMPEGDPVESWVIMVQVINHATEHREQIKSMLNALGVTPPDIDGWAFSEQ